MTDRIGEQVSQELALAQAAYGLFEAGELERDVGHYLAGEFGAIEIDRYRDVIHEAYRKWKSNGGRVQRKPKEPEAPPRIPVATLADIDNTPPGDLLFGMLEPEGSNLLYGPGGVGKGMTCAWLIMQFLAVGIRPLIYDAECHPREWRRRVEGLGGDPAKVCYVEPRSLPKGVMGEPLPKIVPYLGRLCEQEGCGALFVDSLLAAANLSEKGMLTNVSAPYDYTSELHKLGIVSVSLGHPPKHQPTGEPYGSVAWVTAMRMTWLGTRAEGDGHQMRWASKKGNERGRVPGVLLTFDYDEIGRPCHVRREDDEKNTRQWVLDVLAEGPQTVAELADDWLDGTDGRDQDEIGRAKQLMRTTLGRLSRDGLVKKPSKGRNKPWALLTFTEETRKDL